MLFCNRHSLVFTGGPFDEWRLILPWDPKRKWISFSNANSVVCNRWDIVNNGSSGFSIDGIPIDVINTAHHFSERNHGPIVYGPVWVHLISNGTFMVYEGLDVADDDVQSLNVRNLQSSAMDTVQPCQQRLVFARFPLLPPDPSP